DFITPPVDDPYWFGQIGAANSLSDVYAMGGKPLTALSLVMFPSKKLDAGLLKEILRGAGDKVTEANACMAGGHSVDDNEPKYGLAVTGIVHPERILTNSGAQPGDALILTKPLGTGVLFNACLSGKLPYPELELILPQVAALNNKAIEELAKGSGVQIDIFYDKLPFYPSALRMYEKGETTGSNDPNRKLADGLWEAVTKRTSAEEELLFDPQTSGGLLIAVPDTESEELTRKMRQEGVNTAIRVGKVVAQDQLFVRIV
ncbi:MAG: selenide, water dikinase SelD, partial [Deltaproteobacteria bacterium]|nr:selenide, water dikinase SelD [Deltaproteobacteria bacterium]